MRLRPTNLIVLLAVPALATALAPFVAGWHWALDLLACFPVQTMAALWVAALVLFAARRWKVGLVCLLGGALAAFAVFRPLPAAPAATATAANANGPPIRLAALNVLRGNEANATAAVAALREQDPDLVFCSEVTPAWCDALAAGLPGLTHSCLHPDPGYYGAALFSRWPLRAVAVFPLGVAWTPAIRAIADTPQGPLGVLGVHTPRPGNGERAQNLAQALAAIPAALAPLPPAHVVLGDFNATPWNAGFRALLGTGTLTAGTASAVLPTWPAHLPWLLRVPIDHVLASTAVAVVDAHVGSWFGSDHLPLFASVQFAPTPTHR